MRAQRRPPGPSDRSKAEAFKAKAGGVLEPEWDAGTSASGVVGMEDQPRPLNPGNVTDAAHAQEWKNLLSEEQQEQFKRMSAESGVIEETLRINAAQIHNARDETFSLWADKLQVQQIEASNLQEADFLRTVQKYESDQLLKREKILAQVMSFVADTKKEVDSFVSHRKLTFRSSRQSEVEISNTRAFHRRMAVKEERQKQERAELLASHRRVAANRSLQREVRMANDTDEEKEWKRRVERLAAVQLRESQQEEARQLRELHHLQYSHSVRMFEFTQSSTRAVQTLQGEQEAELHDVLSRQANELLEAAAKAVKLDEAVKARQLKELQQEEALNLEATQRRAIRSVTKAQHERAMARQVAAQDSLQADFVDFLVSSKGMSGSTHSSGSKSTTMSASGESLAESMRSSVSGNSDDQEYKIAMDTLTSDKTDTLMMNDLQLEDIEKKREKDVAILKSRHHEEIESLKEQQRAQMKDLVARNMAKGRNLQQEMEQEMKRVRTSHSEETSELETIHKEMLSDMDLQVNVEKSLKKDRTESSHKNRSEFLAYICHELRNPLMGILGLTELLEICLDDGESEVDRAAVRSQVAAIQSQCSLMKGIVNDALDVEKIEQGRLEFDLVPFNVREGMSHVVASFQHQAGARPNFSLEMDLREPLPDFVTTDPMRVKQVLANLLTNAMKFTKEGRVTLRAWVEPRDGGAVEGGSHLLAVEVEDTGIGVAEADMSKLFMSFSQVKASVSREYGGSGMGLAICKALIEQMGGVVGARSEEKKGSTFYFSVPVSLKGVATSNATKHQVAALSSPVGPSFSAERPHRGDGEPFPLPRVPSVERAAAQQAQQQHGGDGGPFPLRRVPSVERAAAQQAQQQHGGDGGPFPLRRVPSVERAAAQQAQQQHEGEGGGGEPESRLHRISSGRANISFDLEEAQGSSARDSFASTSSSGTADSKPAKGPCEGGVGNGTPDAGSVEGEGEGKGMRRSMSAVMDPTFVSQGDPGGGQSADGTRRRSSMDEEVMSSRRRRGAVDLVQNRRGGLRWSDLVRVRGGNLEDGMQEPAFRRLKTDEQPDVADPAAAAAAVLAAWEEEEAKNRKLPRSNSHQDLEGSSSRRSSGSMSLIPMLRTPPLTPRAASTPRGAGSEASEFDVAEVAMDPRPWRPLLIAEDDGVIRKVIAMQVKRLQLPEPDLAPDGLAALELCRKYRYDLVLADINMPRMRGDELAPLLRSELGWEGNIVAVTANALSGDVKRYLSDGAFDGVLHKPFNIKDLRGTIMAFMTEDLFAIGEEMAGGGGLRRLSNP